MWVRNPKYKLKPDLPIIIRHDQLPSGCSLLGQVFDDLENNNWLFIKNNEFLSIVQHYEKTRRDGTYIYRCYQKDFPMEFLHWFSGALTDFQKPPIEGGLPAGAMTSADQDVGGEMLCIQRAMGAGGGRGGYTVRNRSRCKRGHDVNTEFEPHDVCWGDNFLFEGGLLDLIKDLAEKFEQGKI